MHKKNVDGRRRPFIEHRLITGTLRRCTVLARDITHHCDRLSPSPRYLSLPTAVSAASRAAYRPTSRRRPKLRFLLDRLRPFLARFIRHRSTSKCRAFGERVDWRSAQCGVVCPTCEVDLSHRAGPACWAVSEILFPDYAAVAVKVYNEAHSKP
jgi:hypothetical protein